MNIIRFWLSGDIKYGMIKDDVVHGFQENPFGDFRGGSGPFSLDGSTYQMREVKLLAPFTPSKYVGIGLNYRKPTKNLKIPIPEL